MVASNVLSDSRAIGSFGIRMQVVFRKVKSQEDTAEAEPDCLASWTPTFCPLLQRHGRTMNRLQR